VLETKNIAEKGQPRKLWTDFVAFSSPIVVPKYDAKLVQAGFGTRTKQELAPGLYKLRLVAFHADDIERLYSDERAIDLSKDALDFLSKNCITDGNGVRKAHLPIFFEEGSYKAEISAAQVPGQTTGGPTTVRAEDGA
jgi:hypothetical protein